MRVGSIFVIRSQIERKGDKDALVVKGYNCSDEKSNFLGRC